MSDPYKLTIKLPSGAEFQGEGPEDAVKEAYREFLEAVKGTAASAATALPTKPVVIGESLAAEPTGNGSADGVITVERQTLERLFSVDRLGTVSLTALPRTENTDADTLIALIYGHEALRGEAQVTSGRLMKAARQSGLNADRIDRILNTQQNFVTAAGFKKGRKYGLNNPGKRRAVEILKGILG